MRRFVTFGFLSLILWSAAVPVTLSHARGAHVNAQQGDVKIDVHDDFAQQVLTVRIGPINLPAHAHHLELPDLFLSVPLDGWFIAFQARLLDDAGTPLPPRLLHHLVFSNYGRRDFLCTRQVESVFAAGSEMTTFPPQPGVGYRIEKGSRMIISTMFHNPTEISFPRTYVDLRVKYKLITDRPPLKNIYPAWFYVANCPAGGFQFLMFDLKPGKTVHSRQVIVRHAGRLLYLIPHLHDYGREFYLENVSRKERIVTVSPKLDPEGRILSIPTVSFAERGGYILNRGEIIRVTATYNNPTGKTLRKAGMVLGLGYFLPNDQAKFDRLKVRRRGKF